MPGYKFVRRDGVLHLERRGPFDTPQTPSSQVEERPTPFGRQIGGFNDSLKWPKRLELKPSNSKFSLAPASSSTGFTRPRSLLLNADEDTDDGTDVSTDVNTDEKDNKIVITEMRRKAPKSPPPPPPKAPSIKEQIDSLAKAHALTKAEEQAKSIAKSLHSAFDKAVTAFDETKKEGEMLDAKIEKTADEAKNVMAEFDRRAREMEQRLEQKIVEEKQAQEKRERELEIKNKIENRPTTEELIQSLALEQAQQKAQR
jgi:hypothetical protein